MGGRPVWLSSCRQNGAVYMCMIVVTERYWCPDIRANHVLLYTNLLSNHSIILMYVTIVVMSTIVVFCLHSLVFIHTC